MKTVGLLLITFVILLASLPLPTKAIRACGSRSKRDGESCDESKIQTCLDVVNSGLKISTECCKILKEQQSCLCDISYVTKTSKIKTNVLSSRLKSCGILNLRCGNNNINMMRTRNPLVESTPSVESPGGRI
ncbi:LOW QUALITY PROTEIN: non-specific lipid-transfer protein 2P [Arabidopsis lyrata subsp. lyrata]|uniref:LOW QUALITY PROTEIN: non-specific lipid-transfer protein 2P n=1 Tax=Arabidopsis lyrata subsp. lyrata TaxID=81972 RepID=UPI000A29E672|nr:LOW QUALITY PROTEIN: non-specific lipid-transfer protein 2P [Arabidopsis lyrata subsp. lyrata]|eukprot:XP_020890689.1 LOW QUALITY PROTEIN: non-specific lipid-transfer protein 2P [Arabidopsis lyrata subsp. lyrata]